MDFQLNVDYDFAFQLLLSIIIGTAIGFEREYRSKAAGLRTMIMICVGSTIFTEASMSIDNDSLDRIASNIVTGVGFLGAGVIFKDGLTVTGLTTASTIWICAALGTVIGMGEYFVALISSGAVILVLTGLEKVQSIIERLHQSRTYKINYVINADFERSLEEEVKRIKLNFKKRRDLKNREESTLIYEIYGREKHLDKLNEFLKSDQRVVAYEY